MRPFQIAVAEANPLSIMSSYNRVNGVHVGDSKELLDGVLHKEWGWDGMIMSDWFGTYSVDTAILAGQGELRRTLPGIVVADVKRH
jgi:beta-glucosidase